MASLAIKAQFKLGENEKKKKRATLDRNQTEDLLIKKHVSYHCTTAAALIQDENASYWTIDFVIGLMKCYILEQEPFSQSFS